MDFDGFCNMLCSIKPDLKIIFNDELQISVTTTFVMPISSSCYSSFIYKEYQDNFQDFLINFFSKLTFSSSSSFDSKNEFSEDKIDPKEEVDDNQDDLDFLESMESELEDSKGNNEEIKINFLKKGKKKKNEIESTEKTFCTICGKLVKSIQNHMKSHNSEKSSCKFCGKEVKVVQMKRHLKEVHEGEKKCTPAICQICGHVSVTEQALKIHVGSKHSAKIHNCDQCEFKTGSESSLRAHVKNVHGDKKFMCEYCDYSSNIKKNLLEHLKTHSERTFVTCPVCGKSVISLQSHMHSHNTERGNCEICGKEVKLAQMSKHKKNVHGERKYPCQHCSYKAKDSYNLKLHVSKSHLGLKDIPKEQCAHCNIQTTNLNLHLRRYHPEKM